MSLTEDQLKTIFKCLFAVLITILLLAPPALAQATVPPTLVPFSEFLVRLDIEETEFEVRGSFTLGSGSNGINLFKDEVVVRVGPSFTAKIPPGSFKQEERGKMSYTGEIEGITLDVTIRVLGRGKFQLKIEGEGTRNAWELKPEDINLTVGNDGGASASLLVTTANKKE